MSGENRNDLGGYVLCYLCGNPIGRDEDCAARICPECALHYCDSCAPEVTTCYVCGATPVRFEGREIRRTDLSGLFAELAESEKRRQPRKQVRLECSFSFVEESLEGDAEGNHRALTRDVSRGGMCIYSLSPLEVGQRLSFCNVPFLTNQSTAVVRWVRTNDRGTYAAGVKFEKSGPGNGGEEVG